MLLSYEGIFFEGEAEKLIHTLEKVQLPMVNDVIHCTFKYHPDEDQIFDEIVGKEMQVLLTGYGFDGKNSGFELQLPEEIMPYYINYNDENPQMLNKPHITASLTEDTKASKTKNLHFEPLPEPVALTGRFGYWIKDDGHEYVSYEPYKSADGTPPAA